MTTENCRKTFILRRLKCKFKPIYNTSRPLMTAAELASVVDTLKAAASYSIEPSEIVEFLESLPASEVFVGNRCIQCGKVIPANGTSN